MHLLVESRLDEEMATKSRDTRTRAGLLVNAYIEALVGVFALRLDDVKTIVRTHAPEMTVLSSYDGQHINPDARRIVDEISNSGPEIIVTVEQITCAFVAAMWDLLRAHAHYERIATAPEIQFFRHLRNACGHDGRWNFSELKSPAIWRDKTLMLHHRGHPVFGGIMKHGDVMLLFIDIDRQHFEH